MQIGACNLQIVPCNNLQIGADCLHYIVIIVSLLLLLLLFLV